ncbi:MAG: metallophosphoesterase [Candidatus Anaerobiospirillum pullicola]|uniref:Metallophosphoesterase n=1 Tax=Candidatus Anaerobiospirillum pullicola TaxID=2838451 RepID=A0A948WZZ8_9GAMM|nr:metallophosphoesterase [Candidatus Anaerobiospirillum pullicola]
MSTIFLVTLVALAIVIAGFILPLRLSWRSKAIMVVIALIASSKCFLYYLVGGNAYEPNIPYNLAIAFDITRTTMVALACLVIVRLVVNLLSKIATLSFSYTLLPTYSLFHAQLMTLVAVLIGCYGTSCAYDMPEIKPYNLTLEKLDPRLDGMRIAVMSDVHINGTTDPYNIAALVKEINALEPDLIFLPGDLMDGTVEQRQPITDLLLDLKAKYGVFVTTGNHEYYFGYQAWRSYFEKGGFISLDNKVVELRDRNGLPLLNLGGVTDPKAAIANLPTPDVQGVIAALDPAVPALILSHRPQYAPEFAASGKVDVVISGHTHGGLMPILDRTIATTNGGFVSGLYTLGKTQLIVNNGVMVWATLPLRIGVPSQIVLLTLHSAQKPDPDLPLLTRAYDLKQEQLHAQLLAATRETNAVLKNAIAVQQQAATEQATTAAATTATAAEPAAPATAAASDESNTVNARGLALGTLPEKERAATTAVQDLQLILPMKNAEDGSISESVTNVALLPSNLTEDQLQRINAILQEDPAAEAQKRAAALQARLESDPFSGVRMSVRKESTTLNEQLQQQRAAQPVQSQNAAPAQEQVPPGVLHLKPAPAANTANTANAAAASTAAAAVSGNEASAAGQEQSAHSADVAAEAAEDAEVAAMSVAPDTPVLRFESDDTDTTLELQAEYAISLGNAEQQIDDESVDDMLQQQQQQPNSVPISPAQ